MLEDAKHKCSHILLHTHHRTLVQEVLVSPETSSLNLMGFPGGSAVKNLPVMQETRVPSLGQEDPLEEEMATLPSIPARKIPSTEELSGIQSMRLQRVVHGLATQQQT